LRVILAAALTVILSACAGPPGAPLSEANPHWDASPVASDECQIIMSKDLGRIKYCQRGDYAEIFRLD
jgi:hypothetical protein